MNQTYKEHRGLINRQFKELFSVYRDAVKHLDISDSEFWIWYTLVAVDGEHTQQEICGLWSLPKQTVNTVITQLRIKKFAYLEAIPRTRNHKIIRLTESGRRYGESLILPILQAEDNALSKISADEARLVTEIFGKYIGGLREELCGGDAE